MPVTVKSCSDVTVIEAPKCITMPGGVELCATALPNSLDSIHSLFGKLNAALAPLVPIFTMIDVIVSLKNCITAIPHCLGPPPSPAPIIKCTKELIRNLDQLLKMIPQLSIPLLVLGVLDAVIAFISSYRNAIVLLVQRQQALVTQETRAASLNNAQMLVLLGCAKENLKVEFHNLSAGTGPVNQLIGIVNALLDIVGLPCIPGLVIPEELSEAAVKPLDDALKILRSLRKLIPIPSLGNSFGKICK